MNVSTNMLQKTYFKCGNFYFIFLFLTSYQLQRYTNVCFAQVCTQICVYKYMYYFFGYSLRSTTPQLYNFSVGNRLFVSLFALRSFPWQTTFNSHNLQHCPSQSIIFALPHRLFALSAYVSPLSPLSPSSA